MANNQYTVNFWGSDPAEENDDCWTGEEFETRAQAEAEYANPTFTQYVPSRDVAYIELDGPDIHLERRNAGFKPSKAGRDEWQSERAMQAGMAFGCDGYNDEMGW